MLVKFVNTSTRVKLPIGGKKRIRQKKNFFTLKMRISFEDEIEIIQEYKQRINKKCDKCGSNMKIEMKSDKEVILKDAPVSAMTRQPTKGRGNNGGLRIGEMEKDSILSHGMTAFLKESLMERSDKFDYYIDNETHSILNKDLSNAFDVSKVETPFAFKQFVQEMISLGIKPILETEENEENEENYIDHEEMEL